MGLVQIAHVSDALEALLKELFEKPKSMNVSTLRTVASTIDFLSILFERGASIRRATEDFFKRVKISPELALESNDTYFIKLMVEHGMGISLLPSWSVRDEVLAGKLTELRIKGHHLRSSVAMVSLGRFQPSPTRAFLSYILRNKKRLQEMAMPGNEE